MIFTSCQTEFSADPCRVRAGLRRKSLLAVQVCIESRWLKLLLEWFMSAQTLRGQSKHKATPSNLLHPVLQHSCPNGNSLRWMTMKRALAELFALPYIDVKHMQRVVPVTSFHLTRTLMGQKRHFPPSSTKHPKRMEFLMEEHWRIPRIKKKNRRGLKSVCEKREEQSGSGSFW